jgi:protein AroM
MKTRVGMITIGQAPRTDVVPEMADLMGPGVEIAEVGALDGLGHDEIAALAPRGDDEVLVTRLLDGTSVFVGKSLITPLVQRRIEALETREVALNVLLCTGAFKGLHATRPLVEPEKVLVGVLRGIRFSGRLGVVAPSERHVGQTAARWRGHGFEPVVVSVSPYARPTARHDLEAAGITPFGRGEVGLVLLDCMGFRREDRQALQAALGIPVVVANLLVARVVAELVDA